MAASILKNEFIFIAIFKVCSIKYEVPRCPPDGKNFAKTTCPSIGFFRKIYFRDKLCLVSQKLKTFLLKLMWFRRKCKASPALCIF